MFEATQVSIIRRTGQQNVIAVIYNSALKMKDILIHAAVGVTLEDMMLREASAPPEVSGGVKVIDRK